MADRLIQIVPALPPPHEGVGGYALRLAAALGERAQLASRFVTAPGGSPGGDDATLPIHPVATPTAAGLGRRSKRRRGTVPPASRRSSSTTPTTASSDAAAPAGWSTASARCTGAAAAW